MEETNLNTNHDAVNQSYAYAADLLVNQKLSADETKNALLTGE